MKISVSLPEDEVGFLDSYAAEHDTTRSGALLAAVKALRFRDLAWQYEQAFLEAERGFPEDDDWAAELEAKAAARAAG